MAFEEDIEIENELIAANDGELYEENNVSAIIKRDNIMRLFQ